MQAKLVASAQSLIKRAAAIDWRNPRHHPERVAAAYERWMAKPGSSRRVRWVADPADVEAWRARGEGVAAVWAMLAARNPASTPSMIGLLLNSTTDSRAVRWNPAAESATQVAAAWSFTITSHLAAVESNWNEWTTAWADAISNAPLMAEAMSFLCAGVPWPAPPMIASAAAGVLAACADTEVWAAVMDVLTRAQAQERLRAPVAAAVGPIPFERVTNQDEMLAALVATAEPMITACEAGAFAHTLRDDEIVVLAAPAIWTDGRRLHRGDGPALEWPRTKLYAWKGVLVPEEAIMEPKRITPKLVYDMRDDSLRQTLIDIYADRHGHRRCMQDMGGIVLHEDPTGRLWSLNPARLLPQPGDLKMVEVVNGTPEPDGSRKTYWLNVPPDVETARQAVAWTYGLTPNDYDGLVVRT
jgi:hypothetical protein